MGKSAFALALAQELGAEIVSADSMQVYRKLNIGTAKPSPEEQQLVPHHLIDLVEPWENFDLAKYQQLALSAIGDIHSRGKLPLLTGGTGLYVRAVLEDYLFPQKSADKNVRAQLESFTTEQLYARLEEVDPDSALRLHPNDRRRIERAVEVFLVTGKPISQQQAQMSRKKRYRSLAFCLTRERSELYERINKRVDLMMEQGLDLIVVDYLGLMNADRRVENRQLEVSEISRGLKSMALELRVPVLACAQLARWAQSPATAHLSLSVNVSARQFADRAPTQFEQGFGDVMAKADFADGRSNLVFGAAFEFVDLGFRVDVDAPPRQLASQADVLAFFADGQRQFVVRHDEFHPMAFSVDDDAGNFGWRNRVAHETGWIVVVRHDVDLFTTQLLDHGLNPRPFHPNASSYRIDTIVVRLNSYFSTFTRFTNNIFDRN